MRLTTCCPCLRGGHSLEKGTSLIGHFDVLLFLTDLILVILVALTNDPGYFTFLPLPNKGMVKVDPSASMAYAMFLKLILVDLARVMAFGFLKIRGGSVCSRLAMGTLRVATQGIQIMLVAITCYRANRMGVMKFRIGWSIALNVILIMLDVYFSAVIFSWYRRTPQEEIEIELRQLGKT